VLEKGERERERERERDPRHVQQIILCSALPQNRNVENICNGGVAQRQSLRAMRAPYSLCGVCAASLVELEDEQPVQQCMMIGTSTCHDKVRSTVAICSE